MGKILVLDEPSGFRELMLAELGDEGHLVVPIGKPSLLGELINILEPDLLLLDLHLCGADRWDVLDMVKKEVPHMPVLIFSAHAGYPRDPRMVGADGFVMKSFGFEKLKQKVAELLRRKWIHKAEKGRDVRINSRVSIFEAESKAP